MPKKEFSTTQYVVLGIVTGLGAMGGVQLFPGVIGPVVGAIVGAVIGYKLSHKVK